MCWCPINKHFATDQKPPKENDAKNVHAIKEIPYLTTSGYKSSQGPR